MSTQVPVIALTGHLGSGKTTVLNHLLRAPGARVGVVVNDFGRINIDAALVAGQVDEPASIAGGCLCCLPDSGGLDEALERLSHPRLRLDAIVVEASGIAEPGALARMIRFSGAARVRPGGLVDVVDAAEYFATVDPGGLAPARFAAATLVVVNKTDRLAPAEREPTLERIVGRVRERNPGAMVVGTSFGRIDPALVFDAATRPATDDELPLGDPSGHHHDPHPHADAVTSLATGPVDPARLVDLLEDPPTGVYRLKGCVAIDTGSRRRRYLVNVVGRQVHVAEHPRTDTPEALVAIGMSLDPRLVQTRLDHALAPASSRPTAAGLRRLLRHRRLSE